MKQVFIIKIERQLSEEEKDILENLSSVEMESILSEHKENLVEYFTNEGIDTNDIKELDICFKDE